MLIIVSGKYFYGNSLIVKFSHRLSWTTIFLLVLSQVTSANAFAQTLRRYTSLNHLAQAARAVLQNTAQINQMLSDLNRVDFANVQVSLVSELCVLAAFMSRHLNFNVERLSLALVSVMWKCINFCYRL